MSVSTLGQNKVALKKITVKQHEGKSQTHECATLAEACHKMSTLCILGDHYKGGFTIEWEDGGEYSGSALFHEASKDTNPMRMAKEFLDRCVNTDDFGYIPGFDKQAQEMLDRYF